MNDEELPVEQQVPAGVNIENLIPDPDGRPGHWMDTKSGNVYSFGKDEQKQLKAAHSQEQEEAARRAEIAARVEAEMQAEEEKLANAKADAEAKLEAEVKARKGAKE